MFSIWLTSQQIVPISHAFISEKDLFYSRLRIYQQYTQHTSLTIFAGALDDRLNISTWL